MVAQKQAKYDPNTEDTEDSFKPRYVLSKLFLINIAILYLQLQ